MKVSALHQAVAVAVAASIQQLSCQTVNPGFRVIITSKALNYAYDVGLFLLKEWLCNTTISVPGETGLALVNYSFSNISIHPLDPGNSSLTSDERGLVLTVEDFSFSFSADFLIHELDWPYFIDSGSGNFTIRNISFEFSVGLVVNESDPETGSFVLNLTSCSFHVDSVRAVFSGGASYFYNLFGLALNDFMKYELNRKTCSQLTNSINSYINISSFPMTYPVGHGVEMDYALVSDPDLSHPGIIIVESKGEFRLVSSPQEPPFSPPPLPDPSLRNLTSMVYVQATTYVAESASWAFWKAGLMAYNVTNDKIPAGFQTTAFYCDIVAQELCKKFPNEKVMFEIVASDYPRVQVTPEAAVMTGDVDASMYVMDKGRYVLAFTLEIKVKADMQFWFNFSSSRGQYVICGNISNPKVDISLSKSNIGHFNVSTLQNTVNTLAPSIGLGYINEKINGGIPIPTAEGLSFIKPSLTFGKGYVEVSGDVSYSPEILNKLRKGKL